MRLHRLSVTAFGPFAGTEHVDFDELNDAGLFLLTGPTGAGKSSLLDAVCFALYGTVPGVRGVKTLKSQHAPADVAPEVVLDVTVQGRRFVVRRSPEWARRKKRGDGLLVEKASASIVETTGGGEHFLSSRAAEVGHLVTSLMGMNAAQFVQVALLPQGEFQTFLRASSQERHDVLQHLFRTDRFARIEDWVHDRSRRLKERSGDGQSIVRRLVDTVADRAGVATPPPLADDGLAQASADGRVLPWVTEVLAGAEASAATATLRHRQATEQVEAARRHHARAQQRAERRQIRDSARRALSALDESAAVAEDARTALAAHERALQCGPVLALLSQTLEDLAEANHLRAAAVDALAPFEPHDASDAVLSELGDDARRRLAELEALLPREQAAHEALRERDTAQQRLLDAERDQREAAGRAEQLPEEIDLLATEMATVAGRATRAEMLQVALEAGSRRRDASVALVHARAALVDERDAHRDARDHMQDAREHVQTLAAGRLAGIAAELAATLSDGAPCEVCGSVDHPHPAVAVHDLVTDDDQASAEETLAVRVAELDAADSRVRALQSREDVLSAASDGVSPDAAGVEVDRLTRDLTDALDALRQLPALEERLTARRLDLESLGRQQAAAAAGATALRHAVAAHDRTLVSLEAQIGRVLGTTPGDSSVEQASRDLADRLVRLTGAQGAVRQQAEVTRRVDTLTEQARVSTEEQGFAGPADVHRAVLTEPERAGLTALLRERDAAATRAHAVLDDPVHQHDAEDLDASPDADDREAGDDVGSLALALSEAEDVAAQTARARAVAEHRREALRSTRDRLIVAMQEWGPVRDESLRAESMARLVRGMGHDNHLQMRLSAYVLATRLDQVVAAANERLGQMRDQRYLLQRTGRAERRTAQAGLGLEVVDQWTGDVRAPTTLSGGETFVVSLALALGLADVVTHEAGGTEIETLFVDEGFGTLDADTLDDVMDRLDGLRAGGRTVGVVSHVSELRSRIPTQVLVEKGRAGSSVTVHTLVG